MANPVPWVIEQPPAGSELPAGTKIVRWDLAELDTGEPPQPHNEGAPYPCPHYPDKTVQASGDFNGGTLYLEGSNQVEAPTVWNRMHEPSGIDLAMTGPAIEQALENPYFIRPNFTGSTAGAIAVRVVLSTVARR